jgi:hypothetical protein
MIGILRKFFYDFGNYSRAEAGINILFPSLGILLILFSIFSTTLLTKDLKDLSVTENRICNTRIYRNLFIIKINTQDYEFVTNDIKVGKKLRIGDSVKVYFERRIISHRTNILQLEKSNVVMISFIDIKRNSIWMIITCSFLGFSFIWFFIYYVRRLKNK